MEERETKGVQGPRMPTPATLPERLDDALLVQHTLAGDARAFQELVERHQERLFAAVRHYTRNPVEVEDIVQETFLKAFCRLDSFQQQSSFATWIYRIAINTSLDVLKRKGRGAVESLEDPQVVERPAHKALAPDARLQREEIARITQQILQGMPDIFRAVLVMREFEGLSYQEMAEVLCISIGTVESRLFRARARFRAALLKAHPEFEAPDFEAMEG